VVCGHIHHAVIGMRHGVEYINTGDWVESCTAIVEHHDGRLELIDWAQKTRQGESPGLLLQPPATGPEPRSAEAA
jgi:hypothetical protein